MTLGESLPVCEMTPDGIREATEYLSILRDGKRLRTWERDLYELLSDLENATQVHPEIFVQRRSFSNRREAGQYLLPILEPLGGRRIVGNHPLWSWLGMFYLDQAAPRGLFGELQLSKGDAPYVLNPQGKATADRTGQLHRLMVAYEIFARHGEKAWCMLDQPLYRMEHFTMRIVGTTSIFNSVGVVELANLLYADQRTRRYKPGLAGSAEKGGLHNPGSLPRLIAVLNQLYMTYDVYGMTADQLMDLLPPEFNSWKPATSAP